MANKLSYLWICGWLLTAMAMPGQAAEENSFANKAIALLERGQTREAEQVIVRWLDADSANSEAYWLMAKVYYEQEKYPQVLEICRVAQLNQAVRAGLLDLMAKALFLMGDPAAAISVAEAMEIRWQEEVRPGVAR